MVNGIELKFIPESSFLLGGVKVNPAYNAVTAMDENYLPFLTATAIKGALRIEFEAFVLGIGEESLCDFDSDIKGCTTCISCRLFGGDNKEGKLRFNCAELENPDEVLPVKVRKEILAKGKREGVSISRTLGKSKEGAYFTTLTFPNMKKIREIVFKTVIDIRRELDLIEKKYLDMFFKYLSKTGLFMGSRKSIGLGFFSIRSEIPATFKKQPTVDTSRKELKLFQITLKTLEPLLVGNTKNKYIIDTLPYIPASTLGGTIGFRLSEYGIHNETLETMFNIDKTFSTFNLYFKPHNDTPKSFPLPLSQRCQKGKTEPVKDILIPDYIINKAIEQDRFNTQKIKDLFDALYKSNLRPVSICKKPETFYNAKIAIGRELQKTGEGRLYSMELIPKGSKFQGYVIGETWAVETLCEIGELYMGGKRTRGFGRTKFVEKKEIGMNELMKLDSDNSIDEKVKEMADEYSISLPIDRRFFSLDLVSDFALPEEIPKNNRTMKFFLEKVLFHDMGMEIEKTFIEIIKRGGFDFRNKRVKPMVERIGAGSTFLVSIPNSIEKDFLDKIRNSVKESVGYKWDSTPLFLLNNPEHINFGGQNERFFRQIK